MTKQNDHSKWFNYVVSSVNCIAFCDSASKAMMTTVHDPTIKEYAYFDAAKRPNASLKYTKPISSFKSTELTNSTSSASLIESTNSTIYTNLNTP
jgi:hypothetical protein